MKTTLKDNLRQVINIEKSAGNKISRTNLYALGKRHMEENASTIAEAFREQQVLRMKSFYTKRNWSWPPKTHPHVTIVHLINDYYGKEVCVHTPKDKMELELNR